MSETRFSKLEERIEHMSQDLKAIKDVLEMSQVVDPLKWQGLNDLDVRILQTLLAAGHEGHTSPELARLLGLEKPTSSGRIKVWHRLKRLQKISRKRQGALIVILEDRRWRMNWEDFSFGPRYGGQGVN